MSTAPRLKKLVHWYPIYASFRDNQVQLFLKYGLQESITSSWVRISGDRAWKSALLEQLPPATQVFLSPLGKQK